PIYHRALAESLARARAETPNAPGRTSRRIRHNPQLKACFWPRLRPRDPVQTPPPATPMRESPPKRRAVQLHERSAASTQLPGRDIMMTNTLIFSFYGPGRKHRRFTCEFDASKTL